MARIGVMPPTRVATMGRPEAKYSRQTRLEPSEPREAITPMSSEAIACGIPGLDIGSGRAEDGH